jgi:hypothetical protein
MAKEKSKEVEDVNANNVKEELDVFVPTKQLTTVDGKKIVLPKMTWKRETIIYKKVGLLFESVEDLQEIDFAQITASQIVKLVSVFLQKAPDVVTEIVAVITDFSEEEVGEKLDSGSIIELLVPFFSERSQMITQKLEVLNK